MLLEITRVLLFGKAKPRYGRKPPIGGILQADFVKAGAMVGERLKCSLLDGLELLTDPRVREQGVWTRCGHFCSKF